MAEGRTQFKHYFNSARKKGRKTKLRKKCRKRKQRWI